MKSMFVILMGAILAACGNGDASFKGEYKQTFIEGCVNGINAQGPMVKMCECQGQKIVDHFDVDSLGNSEEVKKYSLQATLECMKEELNMDFGTPKN